MRAVPDNSQDDGQSPGRACGDQVEELVNIISQRQRFFRLLAIRHLGNVADAEDAVQDAFLSAIRHLNQFKGKAQLSTWLTAIVINSARMKLRRRQRQPQISMDYGVQEQQGDGPVERQPDLRPNPEEIYLRRERVQLVVRMSTQLSPVVRKAFQLREMDGLSLRETARILGLPGGTVKAQTSRARNKLQRVARDNLAMNRGAAKLQ